eukprot:Gb_00488 [translate_table: standard]
MKALRDLGLNVIKGLVSTDSTGIHNKFSITRANSFSSPAPQQLHLDDGCLIMQKGCLPHLHVICVMLMLTVLLGTIRMMSNLSAVDRAHRPQGGGPRIVGGNTPYYYQQFIEVPSCMAVIDSCAWFDVVDAFYSNLTSISLVMAFIFLP